MKIKLIIRLFLFAFLIPACAWAQEEEKDKNDYQKIFDEFSDSINQEFDDFESKNDSIFYHFLLDSWKEYHLVKDEPLTIPKPKVQPRIDSNDELKIKETKPKIIRKTILEDSGRQIKYQLVPKSYNTIKHAPVFSTFSFYGSVIDTPILSSKPRLTGGEINKNQIANYFRENADNEELITAIYHLKKQAIDKNLNAWGNLSILQEASMVYYTTNNERILFIWLALVKTGYDAIVGYNNKDIYLLVNFDISVYYTYYLNKDGKNYYLITLPGQIAKQESLVSFTNEYPATLNPVSLIISTYPLLASNPKTRDLCYNNKTLNINYNQNIVDFYNNYPACELSVYFGLAPSKLVMESFEIFFDPIFKGINDSEKLLILLDFVQTAFPYGSDDTQFGAENYLFAEETIANNYSDCEDRAILLAQLIRHFTALNAIGLVFSGHVSLAVTIPDDIEGTYVEYNNSKYYIADPTYIGAKLGMMMPEYENEQAEIINF